MKEDTQGYFEKAAECVEDAQFLLEDKRYVAALNRAYYAMLHAAQAALSEKDVFRTSHHATISAFGQYLAKPGLVPAKFHKAFRETFELRLQSDYGISREITFEEARDAAELAIDFVDACRKLCK